MDPATLPPARVVRQAGDAVAPPRVPLRVRLDRVAHPVKIALYYALAFWPLTAVVLFGAAMILAAGNAADP